MTEGVAAEADFEGLPAVVGSAAAATTTPTNNPATATAVIKDLRTNRPTESSFFTDFIVRIRTGFTGNLCPP